MSRDELRLAIEDAADEMLRARQTHGSDQIMMMLSCGFATGALCATLIMSFFMSMH
jgi:hypothetical protein